MRFHASHFTWLLRDEYALVLGLAGGRVAFSPEAKWLYSLRFMLLCWKVEILWTTGHGRATDTERTGSGSRGIGQGMETLPKTGIVPFHSRFNQRGFLRRRSGFSQDGNPDDASFSKGLERTSTIQATVSKKDEPRAKD